MMASVNISGIENNSYNNALRKYRRDKENNRNFSPRKAALLKKNQSAAANFISVSEKSQSNNDSHNNRDLVPCYTSQEHPDDIVKQLPPCPFDILPTISGSDGNNSQNSSLLSADKIKSGSAAFTLEIKPKNNNFENNNDRPELSTKILGFSADDSHLTAEEMKLKLREKDPKKYNEAQNQISKYNDNTYDENPKQNNIENANQLLKNYSVQENRLSRIEDRLENLVEQVNNIGDTLRTEITAFIAEQSPKSENNNNCVSRGDEQSSDPEATK